MAYIWITLLDIININKYFKLIQYIAQVSFEGMSIKLKCTFGFSFFKSYSVTLPSNPAENSLEPCQQMASTDLDSLPGII